MKENTFTEPGPHLSSLDIDAVQNRLYIKFPEDYRQYLLKYNGGQPQRSLLFGLGTSVEPYSAFSSSIHYFYALYNDSEDHYDNFEDFFHILKGRMPTHIFPIARDLAGNQICISSGFDDYGYIYFWDHEEEADEDEEPDYRNLTLLSKSFKEFIEKLEWSREDENQ